MDKITLSKIAEINKTSVTTVYNALNSCTPVDTKLKKDILNTAENMGYFEKNKVHTCDIAVVLPSSPMYFWSEASKGILDRIRNSNSSLKLFTYSNMENEEDFILCIESAKRSNAKVYIVTPISTVNSIKSLNQLNGNVILLNEYVDIENAGYVGADSYLDGQSLATACHDFLVQHPRVLIINSILQHQMALQRKRGFCEALPDNAQIVGEVNFNSSRTLAANIARAIQKNYIGKFDCIFVAQGFFQSVSIALNKLNIVVPCIGCENQHISPKYSKNCEIYCKLVQQIRQQAGTCIEHAINIIEGQEEPGKHITVQSVLILNK